MDEHEQKYRNVREENESPLGRNIYRHRKLQRMTQEQLAGRLHVSCQAISKWENGVSHS